MPTIEAAIAIQSIAAERYANASSLEYSAGYLEWVRKYSSLVANIVDLLDEECDIITAEMLELELRRHDPDYPLIA
tara:strand:- start:1248 stop:1475 length:228 start_codon:yes stop_codon:yes gene_type:complete